MKNYYELLEVSEKASPEIIKKAYTTLVKKYHPDLQPDNKKKEAEEKIKEINEAYEILSDNIKRKNYDAKLQAQRIRDEQSKYARSNSNNKYSNQHTSYNSSDNTPKKVIRKPNIKKHNNDNIYQNDYNKVMNEILNNAYNEAYNNAYNQAYINTLKSMGYEIKYERPFKEKIKIAFSFVCAFFFLSIIGFILWQIPFIKNYFVDLYNDNSLFKFFVDLFFYIVNSFIGIFR